jgi:hypothetical protein
MKERRMLDYYVALFAPRQSPHGLAWSALPGAPVLPDEPPRGPAGRLRRGAARALFGLAGRLDPLAGQAGPDRMHARQAPAS